MKNSTAKKVIVKTDDVVSDKAIVSPVSIEVNKHKLTSVKLITNFNNRVNNIRKDTMKISVDAMIHFMLNGNTDMLDVCKNILSFTSKEERKQLQTLYRNIPVKIKDGSYKGQSISDTMTHASTKQALCNVIGVKFEADMKSAQQWFKTNDVPPNLLTQLYEQYAKLGLKIAGGDTDVMPVKAFTSLLKGLDVSNTNLSATKKTDDDGKLIHPTVMGKIALGLIEIDKIDTKSECKVLQKLMKDTLIEMNRLQMLSKQRKETK